MKKIYLTFLTVFCLSASQAQYSVTYFADGGNPGALQNEDEFDGGGSWTQILANASISAYSNVYSSVQTIPFTFQFNGSAVTQYKVSNTGYLTFTTTHPTAISSTIVSTLPAASIPANSICAWGIYMDNQSSFGKVDYKVFGTVGTRQLWIRFRSFYNPNGTDGFDFTYWAIVLEEGSNKIYVCREWEIDFSGVWQNFPVSVGVQISTSTAIQAPGNPISIAKVNTSNFSSDNDYWAFTPTGTGITENESSSIHIYPNPATDKLTFSETIETLTISDITGKVVMHLNNPVSKTIEISSLENGIYIVIGIAGGKTFQSKFVVEK